MKKLLYVLGAIVSVAYLLNPGAGVFEILPDNLPIVGNLDEAAFLGLLLACVRGWRATVSGGELDQPAQVVGGRDARRLRGS